jgi:hypothetical protein
LVFSQNFRVFSLSTQFLDEFLALHEVLLSLIALPCSQVANSNIFPGEQQERRLRTIEMFLEGLKALPHEEGVRVLLDAAVEDSDVEEGLF